jgi:hypothetical protein
MVEVRSTIFIYNPASVTVGLMIADHLKAGVEPTTGMPCVYQL